MRSSMATPMATHAPTDSTVGCAPISGHGAVTPPNATTPYRTRLACTPLSLELPNKWRLAPFVWETRGRTYPSSDLGVGRACRTHCDLVAGAWGLARAPSPELDNLLTKCR